ncbi:hypothetical protein RJ641_017910 [Dillenia turbinata]|uniref:Uncharacterized protein n=1 Tax=Dillenia turbinata TaxID=194707 RepID=A0AAN8YW09_9MAGN
MLSPSLTLPIYSSLCPQNLKPHLFFVMESSLLLRYVHFPTARARVPCAMAPTLAAKAYPDYAHLASQISRNSIRFSPITCALNLNGLPMLPSSFSQSDNKIDHKNMTSRVSLGASLVLVCVIGIFNCSCRINPCFAEKTDPTLVSYSAQDAVGALLEYFPSLKEYKTQIKRKEKAAIARNYAIEKVKLGKGSEAKNYLESQLVEAKTKLESELKKVSPSSDVDDTVIYELDLAIVEVLIILQSYQEALDRLDAYQKLDPRLHFYRAIAKTMLLAENDKDATSFWTEFRESIKFGPPVTSIVTTVVTTGGSSGSKRPHHD